MKRSIHKFVRTVAPETHGGGDDPTPEPENDAPEAPDGDGDDEDPEPEGEQPEPFDQERAMAKIRKANQEARALRAKAKAAEAKASTADQAEARAEKAEAQLLKLRVAMKYSLPEQLASRLNGTTEEELTKDAEELLQMFTPKVPSGRPKPELRPGSGPSGDLTDDEMDPRKLAAKIARL